MLMSALVCRPSGVVSSNSSPSWELRSWWELSKDAHNVPCFFGIVVCNGDNDNDNDDNDDVVIMIIFQP